MNRFDLPAAPDLPPSLPGDPHKRRLFLADVLWDAFDDTITGLSFGRWIEQQASSGPHRETAVEYLRLRDGRADSGR